MWRPKMSVIASYWDLEVVTTTQHHFNENKHHPMQRGCYKCNNHVSYIWAGYDTLIRTRIESFMIWTMLESQLRDKHRVT